MNPTQTSNGVIETLTEYVIQKMSEFGYPLERTHTGSNKSYVRLESIKRDDPFTISFVIFVDDGYITAFKFYTKRHISKTFHYNEPDFFERLDEYLNG